MGSFDYGGYWEAEENGERALKLFTLILEDKNEPTTEDNE